MEGILDVPFLTNISFYGENGADVGGSYSTSISDSDSKLYTAVACFDLFLADCFTKVLATCIGNWE